MISRQAIFFIVLSYFCVSTFSLQAQPQHKRGGRPFDQMDANNDGKLSRNEFKGPDRAFNNIDSDKNGFIEPKEMRDFRQNRFGKQEKVVKNENTGPYPNLIIKKCDKDKAWHGNVVFVDKNSNRIVESDLDGNIVWECPAPESKVCNLDSGSCSCGSRLTDVELLPNGNLLVLSGGYGVYEITPKGKTVWSYNNSTISHDADCLPNGNIIMACVGAEKESEFPYDDPQAIEVNRDGEIVWAWYAKKEYANSKYKDIRSGDVGDWTHMNSVQRLADDNTLLSVRNWNLLIAVDKEGKTVWSTGEGHLPGQKGGRGSPNCPHTPVLLDNGNIIVSEPLKGRVIEWDPKQEKVVWTYPSTNWRDGGPYYFIRASHRLPNGNTFIIDSLGQFLEVTSSGELVWHAQLKNYIPKTKPPEKGEVQKVPCFNADRRGLAFYGGR